MLLNFNKEDGVNRKEDQVDAEKDHDEEEMEDTRLDEKIDHHCRMVFEENNGGVDDKKYILHAKRWGVYINDKKVLIKGGYYV